MNLPAYISAEKNIFMQYPLFARLEIIAENIKSAQELPKIEIKYEHFANSMQNETISYVTSAQRK